MTSILITFVIVLLYFPVKIMFEHYAPGDRFAYYLLGVAFGLIAAMISAVIS